METIKTSVFLRTMKVMFGSLCSFMKIEFLGALQKVHPFIDRFSMIEKSFFHLLWPDMVEDLASS